VTDEAFWDACYERHHHIRTFLAREAYISLAAKDQVAKLAAEAEARMDVAAEKARTEADKSAYDLIDAMESLGEMGIEQSDDYDLAVELEKAMMEDSDSEGPSMPSHSAVGFQEAVLVSIDHEEKAIFCEA